MTRIAENDKLTKHREEIAFFNALVIDLKKVLWRRGSLPAAEGPEHIIDMDRLEEATNHLAKLAECKEQVRWK